MLYLYFCGICMGMADLIPGISGGTIAFIMGFYAPLLESLKSINLTSLRLLTRGKLLSFFKAIEWRFLLPLGAGIITAFVGLVEVIHFILSHQEYSRFLYAGFTGLILGSTIFCVKQVNWSIVSGLLFVLGLAAAWHFTGEQANSLAIYQPQYYFDPWLIFCGAFAISAMLLPGISGSYLLTLFGVYPTVISALTHFLRALRSAAFDVDAFFVLFSLGIGIILGLVGFVRVISWLLKYHPNWTIALLSGFMIGGLRSVWPFTLENEFPHSLLLVCCSGLGLSLVFFVEFLAHRKSMAS